MTDGREHEHGFVWPGGKPVTVLVVEPDVVLREFLRRLLERHGFSVLLAGNPEQALLILMRSEVVLDVILHAESMLHGDDRRVSARFASVEPSRPVVTYGGDGRTTSGQGRQLFDGERLVREARSAARARFRDR